MSPRTSGKPAGRKRVPGASTQQKADYRSAERISELIGNIYDCALDPGKWEATLANINREFSFHSSALGIVPLRAGVQWANVQVGIDPEWIELGTKYTADAVALWGGAERVDQYPFDEPIVASRIDAYDNHHSNRYFRDVLEPRGMVDTVMLMLARDQSLLAYAGFNRHETAGLIGEGEIETMRILGPHFRRAVTISDLFDMKAIEIATFGTVLDSFAFGIVLVDEHLGIVHANQPAQALLAARDPLRSEGGALIVAERTAHSALQRAVRDAAGDQVRLGSKGIGLPIRNAGGESFVIHVLPLGSAMMRRSLGQRASAALFVAPAIAPRRMPTDALTLLYDLTPAEARIAELLAAGMTQAAIGQMLGIAPSTVKSHVLHLFDKTGCRRQADLVRLASNLSLPV